MGGRHEHTADSMDSCYLHDPRDDHGTAGYPSVEIDIRSNSINPHARGIALVAIYGSEEFDVTEINVARLQE